MYTEHDEEYPYHYGYDDYPSEEEIRSHWENAIEDSVNALNAAMEYVVSIANDMDNRAGQFNPLDRDLHELIESCASRIASMATQATTHA